MGIQIKKQIENSVLKKKNFFPCGPLVDIRPVSCLCLLFEAQMQTVVLLLLKLVSKCIVGRLIPWPGATWADNW